MPTSKESKNLYQRLLAITEEVGKIDKTGTNTSQGYKFIESAMVVAEIRVQMAKHGVMIMPETISRKIDRYTTIKPGYKPNDPPKESVSFHVNVGSRYTIINADSPEERFVCEWDGGEALDTSDKATNKATTASEKTFLMKLFKISDKDDPDANHHEVEPPRATIDPPAPEEPSVQVDEDLGKKKEDRVALIKNMRELLNKAGHTTPEEAEAVYIAVLGKKGPTTAGEIREVIKSLEGGE